MISESVPANNQYGSFEYGTSNSLQVTVILRGKKNRGKRRIVIRNKSHHLFVDLY